MGNYVGMHGEKLQRLCHGSRLIHSASCKMVV
jgi:hypothetical protein